MPARPQGVYLDKRGKWYFKVTVGHDPLTGKRDQITRRGFRTAAEAGRAHTVDCASEPAASTHPTQNRIPTNIFALVFELIGRFPRR